MASYHLSAGIILYHPSTNLSRYYYVVDINAEKVLKECTIVSLHGVSKHMENPEQFLSTNIALYTVLGVFLRFVIYGAPSLAGVGLFLGLSFLVGVGGGLLALGLRINRRNWVIIGVLLTIIGLLPIHYLI